MTFRAAAQALDASLARTHPLTQFGFDALVAGAARPRPGAPAFVDRHGDSTDDVSYADLYQRVGAFLARLRGFDFARGEKILICCPPGAQAFVALTAAVAAGLDPVLAPLPLPMRRAAVANAARAQRVCALFAPARFCGVDFEEPLLSIAAETPSVRLIGALSGTLDGAGDFSPAMLEAPLSPRARLADDWSADERALVGALDDVGAIDFSSQGALLAGALDLVRLTRDAGDAPILSLAAPSSLGALIAGPLAALLAGAPLHYLSPFTAERFLETLDALGPTRLVIPAVVLPDLARAGLLTNGALVSVCALYPGAATAPGIDAADACPIVELRLDGGAVILRDAGASHAPAHVEPAHAALDY
ncbi:AMP-binding protein [Methylocystis sp. WRRC1]|uniref:AMP-binding protein n=1 Tax=Methylocystis sp. WRRC1 TaxID=1732014 RepID=UPI001D150B91|nr:AMP-binding protein [Methylocystis sp. WRRC1]MCC3245502.1 AMP-binding protein [Methylocystis sp. WRRC1]